MTQAAKPAGRVIQATFSFAVPAGATPDQILEWVTDRLGAGCADPDNPLDAYELEALEEPTLVDTQTRYREAEIPQPGPDNRRRVLIRRWVEPDAR